MSSRKPGAPEVDRCAVSMHEKDAGSDRRTLAIDNNLTRVRGRLAFVNSREDRDVSVNGLIRNHGEWLRRGANMFCHLIGRIEDIIAGR